MNVHHPTLIETLLNIHVFHVYLYNVPGLVIAHTVG